VNNEKKTWKTPTLKEFPMTMEISAYRCATIDDERD